MTPTTHTCTECGRVLSSNSLGDRCPSCLLLLALTPPPEEFIEETPVLPQGTAAAERRFFGSYELVSEIARGGMGVVYRARQFDPEREVALKMIHPAGRATPAARLRFQVEVAAVARLHHPRIVSLYESGEQEGVCYYTMRLIQGAGLDECLADRKLAGDPATRVDLLIKVAHAVHYAHERGILHRDLKPSNILIDADGEPCIADFGLAKFQESDAGLTQDQSVLGSPSYMAPEQAAGKGDAVTTSADIYSLGAILYELLTGTPPFLARTPLETLRQVVEQPPLPLRKRVLGLSRDLESICLKALEKEPSRRYSSALALAEDLERWRRGEPVQTRPVSTMESAWRWCLRKPAWAALLGVSLLSLLTLSVGSTLVARRLQLASDETHQVVRRLQLENAEGYLAGDETAKGLAVLAHLLRDQLDDDVVGTRLMSALSQRSFAVPLVSPWGSGAEVLAVGFTTDGQFSTGVARNGAFRRLELATGQTWDAALAGPDEWLSAAAIHENGELAASAHADGSVRLWRTAKPQVSIAVLVHESPVRLLLFNRDATMLATVDQQNTVRWWRSAAGRGWTGTRLPIPTDDTVNSVDFSPDGSWFASVSESGVLSLLPVTDGAEKPLQFNLPGRGEMLAFDPASRRLAVASGWSALTIWALDDLDASPMRLVLETTCTDLEFSPDGRFLAAAGWSSHNRAFVWDTTTGAQIGPQLLHQGNVTSVKFSPDGRELMTQGHDHRGRRWDTVNWQPLGATLVHITAPLQVAYDATGRRLVTGSYSGVAWWDLSPPAGKPILLAHADRVIRGEFSPDGSTVATGTTAGRVHLWNVGDRSLRRVIQAQQDAVLSLRYNHGGDQFLTFGIKGTVRIWDAGTGQATGFPLTHPAPIYSAIFSSDDQRLLTAGTDGIARLWNGASGERTGPDMNHGAPLIGAEFDQGGKRIVTYGENRELRLWDAQTGRPVGTPLLFGSVVRHADFSSDGQWLVAAGQETHVGLWEAATGRFAGEPLRHQNSVLMAAFSPDSAWLASASTDSTAQVVRLGAGTAPVLIQHSASVTQLSFSPDSRWLLTCSQDGRTRVWDPATGSPVSEPLQSDDSSEIWAAFSPDASLVLTVGGDRNARLWPVPKYRSAFGPTLATVAEAVGRMTVGKENLFLIAQPPDWESLPKPLDLSKMLYPPTDGRRQEPGGHH